MASPLPHHRSDGSRNGSVETIRVQYPPTAEVVSRRASRACILGASDGPTPRPLLTFAMRSREDSPTLGPPTGHTTQLPRSAVRPSVHRRPTHQAQSFCERRTSRSRARPSRLCHPTGSGSCPRSAHVPRGLQTPPRGDALALHWSFGSTHTWSRNFHPTHDRMHSTHAPGAVARRCVPRPLSGVVTQAPPLCIQMAGSCPPLAWFER